jgi:hypothetical protein
MKEISSDVHKYTIPSGWCVFTSPCFQCDVKTFMPLGLFVQKLADGSLNGYRISR